MAQGLLDAQPAQPAPQAQPAAPEAANGAPKYASKVSEVLPPHLLGAFRKAVAVGKRLFYGDELKEQVQQAMAGDKPIWQKISEGVARLVMLIDQQSKKTMPQEIIPPLGIELVTEIANFLAERGEKISDEDRQTATLYVTILLMKSYGATDEQIQSMTQQLPPGAGPEAAPAPQDQTQPAAQPMIGA